MAAHSAASRNTKFPNFRYMECRRNLTPHSYSLDGCPAFVPGGPLGTNGYSLCATCGCHMSYHRIEVLSASVVVAATPLPPLPPRPPRRPQTMAASQHPPPQTPIAPPPPPPHPRVVDKSSLVGEKSKPPKKRRVNWVDWSATSAPDNTGV